MPIPQKTRTLLDKMFEAAGTSREELSDRVKWDKRFIEMSFLIGSWSKDPSTKAGAVIVDEDNRVVSMGYNGLPRGIPDSHVFLEDREIKLKSVIHAEKNAILFARRPLENCSIYVTPFQPCAGCASHIVQSGIGRVVTTDYHDERWATDFALAEQILNSADVIFAQYVWDSWRTQMTENTHDRVAS